MKRYLRAMLGVTLLEILLVLAVAAFVIIMSIRYYESTRTAAAVQDLEGAVSAIIATADNYALGSGTYVGLNADAIYSTLPNSAKGSGVHTLASPWGDLTFTFTPAAGTGGAGGSYTASINAGTAPAIVCVSLAGYINKTSSDHMSAGTPATCSASGSAGGTVNWTYYLNKQ